MARKAQEPILLSVQWGCLVCPLDADGTFGAEFEDFSDFTEHLATCHPELRDQACWPPLGTRVRRVKINAKRYTSETFEWKIPDGKDLCVQYVVTPK